jgi:hypothetical protein
MQSHPTMSHWQPLGSSGKLYAIHKRECCKLPSSVRDCPGYQSGVLIRCSDSSVGTLVVDRRFAPQYNNDIEASMKNVTLTGTSPKSVPESLLEFNGSVIETSFSLPRTLPPQHG